MKKRLLLFYTLLCNLLLHAQEDAENITVAVSRERNVWYASPWTWIIGAALFILVLVVLTRDKKEGK